MKQSLRSIHTPSIQGVRDESAQVGASIGGTTYETVAEALAASTSGDTIKLESNGYENVTIGPGKDVTIDLNGHTITGKYDANVSTFTISGGAKVTFQDSGSGGGTVKNSAPGVEKGGGLYISGEDAEAVWQGGSISRCTANAGGGVLADSGACFTLAGGAIEGNTARCFGGGIAACGSFSNTDNPGNIWTDVKITGGTVGNNQSEGEGGGICLGSTGYHYRPETDDNAYSAARLEMTGGKLEGNFSASNGGGMYVQAGCKAYITGGKILSNTIGDAASTYGGAGMYVNGLGDEFLSQVPNGELYIENALITGNRGTHSVIAACPTAYTFIYPYKGALIHANGLSQDDLDIYVNEKGPNFSTAYPSPNGDPNMFISDYALGGMSYEWNGKVHVSDAVAQLDDPAKYQNSYGGLFMLSGHEEALEAAAQDLLTQDVIKVEISGNVANRGYGGAIGSNGTVSIGEKKLFP